MCTVTRAVCWATDASTSSPRAFGLGSQFDSVCSASINPFNWVSQKFQSRFLEPRSDHVSEKAKAEKKKKALEAKRAARPEELSVFDAAAEDGTEVDSAESEKRVQKVNPRESVRISLHCQCLLLTDRSTNTRR